MGMMHIESIIFLFGSWDSEVSDQVFSSFDDDLIPNYGIVLSGLNF